MRAFKLATGITVAAQNKNWNFTQTCETISANSSECKVG